MRQNIRYQSLVIPSKIRVEIRLSMDDQHNPLYQYNGESGDQNTSISLFPFIGISIVRKGELGEDGKRTRAPWNPNDHLSMTKYNLPIFINAFKDIYQGMKTKDLYTYQGKRLELNEEVGKTIRQAFMIGQTAVELTPIVIVQEDDSRLEGIKMKFNNEQSHVLLTLNDMWSLYYNLTRIPIDVLALGIYESYAKKSAFDINNVKKVETQPKIDISF